MKRSAISLFVAMTVVFYGCQSRYEIQPELRLVDTAIHDFKRDIRYVLQDLVSVDFDVIDTPSAEKAFAVFLKQYPRGYMLSPDAQWNFKGYSKGYFYWIGQDTEYNFWVVVVERGKRRFYITRGGLRYTEKHTAEPAATDNAV